MACGFTGDEAGGPGGLEVVASDGAGDIEYFSAEIEARDDEGFHGVRIDFIQGDTARNDLAFDENDILNFADCPAF